MPTALAHVCETPEEVADALDAFGPPYVVKDDALAAGKGVVVTDDRQEAVDHAAACGRVVIEEFLDGPELSLRLRTSMLVANRPSFRREATSPPISRRCESGTARPATSTTTACAGR